MGRGKIKKIKPVSLQARKAAMAQQQQLQAQKAALERQIAEERSKQARLQREIEEKERLVRGLERVGQEQERAFFENQGMYEGPEKGVYLHRKPGTPPPPPTQTTTTATAAKTRDALVPISDKALSMLNHMLGNRGLMQRDPTTGAIDVVLNPESLASGAEDFTDDGSGLLAGMNGILAQSAHDADGEESTAETREALAEAMAAMKAAAHVAKALPLMMLKTAAQAMASGPSAQQHDAPFLAGEGQMVIDPTMMDEHLTEFRAMMEDPEERARLGVGFEMLGWAMGEHPGQGRDGPQGQGEPGPLPTLEEMLKLPIFNNEAFRSSPMFGKPAATTHHQPHPSSGELFLESTDAPTPIDLYNLDMMSDFLASAPAMLGGPLFGGGRAGNSGRPQPGMGMSVSMAMRQVPPPPHGQNEDYPGDITASEAVKAVTQLLEASSRKLQRVTEEQGGETSRAQPGVEAMNVRLDRTGQQPGRTDPALPIPAAAAQAILQARARDQIAADQEDSDIDAFSVDGDVEAFDEDDEDEAYYSDEEYDDEEYDEEEGTYDGEESDYSHEGSSCYESEDDEADDEEHYPAAEVMPFHAPGRRKHPNDPTHEPATRHPNDPNTPPRPHYSTIPYLPGSRRNPVTGKQMREILDRLSPAARHNYQQALIREHQLEMEAHGRPEQVPPPTQQQVPPPPQDRQPSVLDDPAVMDQAVGELFSWIKAVIWTIEQHAIRAARAQMEAKGVGGAGGSGIPATPNTNAPPSTTTAKGSATWTPKATPDGERMRAMMRTVGIDVAPA